MAPRVTRRRLAGLLALLCGLSLAVLGCRPPAPSVGPPPEGSYLFCFWNVENLFDDRIDGWTNDPDEGFDRWLAGDRRARERKYANLADVLLGMNGGRGPDILALAEVESFRAAELLQQELNGRLADPALHYKEPVYKDPAGGRAIAPALLTRLKVQRDRTRLLGKRQRTLEVHLDVDGRELAVIASHWASRLRKSGEASRANYADAIYGRYRAMAKADPKVALLVCGDFNDDPTDPSVVEHLRAVGDRRKVLRGGEPVLYNLFARLHDEGQATLFYGSKKHVFDQIVVSPALLTGPGLRVDPESARVVEEKAFKGRPDRFGGKNDKRPLDRRGASDHFPVTVRIEVD